MMGRPSRWIIILGRRIKEGGRPFFVGVRGRGAMLECRLVRTRLQAEVKPKNLTVFSGLRDRIISSENGFSRWRVILGVLVLRRSLQSSMS